MQKLQKTVAVLVLSNMAYMTCLSAMAGSTNSAVNQSISNAAENVKNLIVDQNTSSAINKTVGDASFSITAPPPLPAPVTTYTSSDPAVAAINATGNITVGKIGSAIITTTQTINNITVSVKATTVNVAAAPPLPPGYFTTNSPKLVWSKPDGVARKWADAKEYCNGTINGQTGWRLPSKDELIAFQNERVTQYVAAGWPQYDYYWSNWPTVPPYVYLYSFFNKGGGADPETKSHVVTCVRKF